MHGFETLYTIRSLNRLNFDVFFWIFERMVFYELFCEGPSALRKYALTAVRGLRGHFTECHSQTPKQKEGEQ